MHTLGPMLVQKKKVEYQFKHLGRRFDRELVTQLRGSPFTTVEEELVKKIGGARFCQIVCMGLNVATTTPIPKGHARDQFEGPLAAVLRERHSVIGNRLLDIQACDLDTLAYFYITPKTPFTVVSPWLKVELVMPWDESTLTANGPWSLLSERSIDDCYITSARWDMKYLKDMIDEQFPNNDNVDETAVFASPNAADGFLQVALPVGIVYEAASMPTKGSAPVEVLGPGAQPVFTGEAIPVLPAL